VEKRKCCRVEVEVMTREYTINLQKLLYCYIFKKMALKVVKEIMKFSQKAMGITNVRLDLKLNKDVRSKGIKMYGVGASTCMEQRH